MIILRLNCRCCGCDRNKARFYKIKRPATIARRSNFREDPVDATRPLSSVAPCAGMVVEPGGIEPPTSCMPF
jgi:hypothetical protein